MKAKPMIWFAIGLCGLAAAVILTMTDVGRPLAGSCKPIDPKLLASLLDEDQRAVEADFIAKAQRLNDGGQCVYEGGYSSKQQNFYFLIDKDGQPQNRSVLRFSREELKK